MERLILFDIDGILTRTQNGYVPFNEAILKTFGIDGDIRAVVPDGNTDPMIVTDIFAKANVEIEIQKGEWRKFTANLPAIAKRCWQEMSGRALSPVQCIVIGDAPKDLQAARQNQMKCILVGTGRYPVEELTYWQPDGCLADLSDTESVIAMLSEI